MEQAACAIINLRSAATGDGSNGKGRYKPQGEGTCRRGPEWCDRCGTRSACARARRKRPGAQDITRERQGHREACRGRAWFQKRQIGWQAPRREATCPNVKTSRTLSARGRFLFKACCRPFRFSWSGRSGRRSSPSSRQRRSPSRTSPCCRPEHRPPHRHAARNWTRRRDRHASR